jgi:hypothetical protein
MSLRHRNDGALKATPSSVRNQDVVIACWEAMELLSVDLEPLTSGITIRSPITLVIEKGLTPLKCGLVRLSLEGDHFQWIFPSCAIRSLFALGCGEDVAHNAVDNWQLQVQCLPDDRCKSSAQASGSR